MDIIETLKNAFANKAFFIRIYEEGKYVIFWNDHSIQKKYPKSKFTKDAKSKISDIQKKIKN